MDLEDNHIATIWLELSINSKKSMLVIGGYRQWRLPKQLNLPNSNKSKNKIERFEKNLNQWERAILEQNDNMVLMDSNIDTGI